MRLLAAAAERALRLVERPPLVTSVVASENILTIWSYVTVGAMAGFLSGMLGVGGGGIVVLAFSVIFHTPILGGLPLALAINVVNASSGVFAQRGTGQTHWDDVAKLVPAALVGIAVGVALAIVMPGNALKVIFALFFVYMGWRLVRRGAKLR